MKKFMRYLVPYLTQRMIIVMTVSFQTLTVPILTELLAHHKGHNGGRGEGGGGVRKSNNVGA